MLKCLGVKYTDSDNFFEIHQKIKRTGRKKKKRRKNSAYYLILM